jgi:hypothetical protein
MLQIVSRLHHLKTSSKPYHVRSYTSDTVEVQELVEIMAAGRTAISGIEIAGCFRLFAEEFIKLVADGKLVKTPIGSFYLSASGTLDTKNQPFAPGDSSQDHGFSIHYLPDKNTDAAIKRQARWAQVETFRTMAPVIDDCTVIGRHPGEKVRAGDILRIIGRRLKFDEADPDCGVFLENDTTHERCAVYADITPSKLIVATPANLPSGSYDILVSTKPNGIDKKTCYAHQTIATR